MTHFRIRLRNPDLVLFEAHKDVARLGAGWWRILRDHWETYVVVDYCKAEDEACKEYQAWLALKGAHEDEKEAEALRGGGA